MKLSILIFFVATIFSCNSKPVIHNTKGDTACVAVQFVIGISVNSGAALRIIKDSQKIVDEELRWTKDTGYYFCYMDSIRDEKGKAKYDSSKKAWPTAVKVSPLRQSTRYIKEIGIYYDRPEGGWIGGNK